MSKATAGNTAPDFLAEGNSMGVLMRAQDWSGTPLGPLEDWPQPLRILVSVMLGSRQPMFIAWGAERTLLYNDDYASLLGQRHPEALGRPFFQVWNDARDVMEPIMDRAFTGKAVQMDEISLVLYRHGYQEEAHFAFSYTPVRDQTEQVAGIFCVCTETTERVLNERRQAFQLKLERRLRDLADPKAITAAAADLLGRHLQAVKIGYAAGDANGYVTTDAEFNDGRMPSTAYRRYFLDDYGPDMVKDLKAGRDVVVRDVRRDPRTCSPTSLAAYTAIGLRAFADVPLVKEGRLVAYLYAAHPEPRNWSKEDLGLMH
jgi:PAS domain S-box-containing protein